MFVLVVAVAFVWGIVSIHFHEVRVSGVHFGRLECQYATMATACTHEERKRRVCVCVAHT